MTIYTRKGDKGSTIFKDNTVILKCDKILEIKGILEELNICIGKLIVEIFNDKDYKREYFEKICHLLRILQVNIIKIDTIIVKKQDLHKIEEKDIKYLEDIIDELQLENKENIYFNSLPGFCMTEITSKMCWVLTRKLERRISSKIINYNTLAYINRLSDLFIILSKNLQKYKGFEDLYLEDIDKRLI